MNQQALSSFIWSVADLLRGDYKQSDYGKVILPLTILRRLDCILAPTKETVLNEKVAKEAMGMNPAPFLAKKAGQPFYNTSPIDMKNRLRIAIPLTVRQTQCTAAAHPTRRQSGH